MMRVSFDAVKGGKLKEMWVVRSARPARPRRAAHAPTTRLDACSPVV